MGIEKRIENGFQYRNVQRIDVAEDEKVVTGYATTFNDPYTLWSRDGYTFTEQVDTHAFDETDLSDVIMQYDHEGRVFARTRNDTLTLRIDDHGLAIRADLGGTELGRQLYEEIRGGYTTKMSFGFTVDEDEQTVTENHDNGTTEVLRTIKKIGKLYDVSAVSLPANDATSISARNQGERMLAEIQMEISAREARERQKQRIRILMEVNK